MLHAAGGWQANTLSAPSDLQRAAAATKEKEENGEIVKQ